MLQKPNIDLEYLKQCFTLDEFGILIWLERPENHFPTRRDWHLWCFKAADRRCGVSVWKNYPYVMMTIGGKRKRLAVHRLVWALCNGRWPDDEIDHIDGDPGNNHPSNLRQADRGQQNQNADYRPGKSGVVGVSWDAAKNRWRARVRIGGKRIDRYAKTREEAEAKRAALKAAHHEFHPQVVNRVKRDIMRV
jgi:hypothetical protein